MIAPKRKNYCQEPQSTGRQIIRLSVGSTHDHQRSACVYSSTWDFQGEPLNSSNLNFLYCLWTLKLPFNGIGGYPPFSSLQRFVTNKISSELVYAWVNPLPMLGHGLASNSARMGMGLAHCRPRLSTGLASCRMRAQD